jgi:hypothetical protein
VGHKTGEKSTSNPLSLAEIFIDELSKELHPPH